MEQRQTREFFHSWEVSDDAGERYAFTNTWGLSYQSLYVTGSERIEDYKPIHFDAQCAEAKTVLGFLKLRWPTITKWTVPPEPPEFLMNDLMNARAGPICQRCHGEGSLTRFRGPGATNAYRPPCEACAGSGIRPNTYWDEEDEEKT